MVQRDLAGSGAASSGGGGGGKSSLVGLKPAGAEDFLGGIVPW